MFCPKCGNELDLFADKCLRCGKSFKGMTFKQKLESYGKKRPFKRGDIPKGYGENVKTHMRDALKSPTFPSTLRMDYSKEGDI